MNNQEIIEKLDGYCEWCKAQGGHCQAYLDGCSIFDIITNLEQQPGRIARFFWRLFGVTEFGLPHIKAGEIPPPPKATEISKSYGRVLDNVVAAFATTDDEIIQQRVQVAVDQGRKVCRELDRQAKVIAIQDEDIAGFQEDLLKEAQRGDKLEKQIEGFEERLQNLYAGALSPESRLNGYAVVLESMRKIRDERIARITQLEGFIKWGEREEVYKTWLKDQAPKDAKR